MVTVLLATYNGSKYIREQIDSLLSQTYKDITILVHDDGSSDSTVDTLLSYNAKYPDKIKLLDAPSMGSACANFAFLLSRCDDDYIMFCDQDDVWLPTKIEETLAQMHKAEDEYGTDTPILVHSDLTVTDSRLGIISHSFFKYQKLDPDRVALQHLLVQNCVTGCTVMINRALKKRSGEIPKECAMHDWYLALIAATFGRIIVINKPLIYYRQHSNNSVGAKSATSLSYIVNKLRKIKKVRSDYLTTYIQARIIRQRFVGEIPPDAQKIINAYCNMSELGKIGRIKLMRHYDFRKNTRLRVIGQYIII